MVPEATTEDRTSGPTRWIVLVVLVVLVVQVERAGAR